MVNGILHPSTTTTFFAFELKLRAAFFNERRMLLELYMVGFVAFNTVIVTEHQRQQPTEKKTMKYFCSEKKDIRAGRLRWGAGK
jgi:hypothetical protein